MDLDYIGSKHEVDNDNRNYHKVSSSSPPSRRIAPSSFSQTSTTSNSLALPNRKSKLSLKKHGKRKKKRIVSSNISSKISHIHQPNPNNTQTSDTTTDPIHTPCRKRPRQQLHPELSTSCQINSSSNSCDGKSPHPQKFSNSLGMTSKPTTINDTLTSNPNVIEGEDYDYYRKHCHDGVREAKDQVMSLLDKKKKDNFRNIGSSTNRNKEKTGTLKKDVKAAPLKNDDCTQDKDKPSHSTSNNFSKENGVMQCSTVTEKGHEKLNVSSTSSLSSPISMSIKTNDVNREKVKGHDHKITTNSSNSSFPPKDNDMQDYNGNNNILIIHCEDIDGRGLYNNRNEDGNNCRRKKQNHERKEKNIGILNDKTSHTNQQHFNNKSLHAKDKNICQITSKSATDAEVSSDEDSWFPSPAFKKQKRSSSIIHNNADKKKDSSRSYIHAIIDDPKPHKRHQENCTVIDLEDDISQGISISSNIVHEKSDDEKNSAKDIYLPSTIKTKSTKDDSPHEEEFNDNITNTMNKCDSNDVDNANNSVRRLLSPNIPKQPQHYNLHNSDTNKRNTTDYDNHHTLRNVEKAETIVLVDDEDDDEIDFNISKVKKVNDYKKELEIKDKYKSSHCEKRLLVTKSNPESNAGMDSKTQKCSKHTRKGGKRKTKLCAMCSTCSSSRCTNSHNYLEVVKENSLSSSFARSNEEIERSLIGRLTKLEKSAAWYDHLCYKVNRELKKHRSTMIKKNQQNGNKSNNNGKNGSPTFLADANVSDNYFMKNGIDPPISTSCVNKAQWKIFSYRKKRQPTLTQMLGQENDCKSHIEENYDQQNRKDICESDEEANNDEINSNVGNEHIDYLQTEIDVPRLTDTDKGNQHAANIANEDEYSEVDNPMMEFHDAMYRKENRMEELGLIQNDSMIHGEDVNIMWNLCSKTSNADISKIPITATLAASSKFDDNKDYYKFSKNCILTYDNKSKRMSENMDNHDVLPHSLQDDDPFKTNDGDGLSQLLKLFGGLEEENFVTNHFIADEEGIDIMEDNSISDNFSPKGFSQLSMEARIAAKNIERDVYEDSNKRILLEKVCPKWKENISFALLQKDKDELNDALQNIKEAKKRLDESMQKITAMYNEKTAALDLYQTAVTKSLHRKREKRQHYHVADKDGLANTRDKSNITPTVSNEEKPDTSISKSPKNLFTIAERDDECAEYLLSPTNDEKKENDSIAEHDDECAEYSISPTNDEKQENDSTAVETEEASEACENNIRLLQSMELSELKSKMEQYGFKALSRGRMIDKLTQVYKAIEIESSRNKIDIEVRSRGSIQNCTNKEPQDENIESDEKLKQSQCTSHSGPTDEVSTVKKSVTKSKNKKDLTEIYNQCRQAVDQEENIKIRILMHESIELTLIQDVMAEAGVKISKKDLMGWLDASSIRYADPWRQRK